MKIAAVILAAGGGSRLGGVAKALLRDGDRTYLEQIAQTARAVGLADAVVVVGPPFGDAVAAEARRLGLRVVVNADPARGMASSVALGFGALADGDAAWLWPVDHPRVRVETLQRLIDHLRTPSGSAARPGEAGTCEGGDGHQDAVSPVFGGRGGHPPLIDRTLWAALAACGDHPDGARGLLRGANVIAVAVDDPGVVRDVDTPADLEASA